MKFEFMIQAFDRPDNGIHKNVKLGDIIVARPYPWDWGLNEIKHGLIVIVDIPWSLNPMPDISSITKLQLARFLRKTGQWYRLKAYPQETIDDCFTRLDALPIAELRTLVVNAWRGYERDRVDRFLSSRLFDYGIHESEILDPDHEDPDYVTAKMNFEDPVICTNPNTTDTLLIGSRLWRQRPFPTGKRKFRLPIARIQQWVTNNLDLDKVMNPDYIYQPFKKATQLVRCFDGQNGSHYVTIGDVDCTIPGVLAAEDEGATNWVATTSPVPQDKYDDTDNDPYEEAPPDLETD